jgi:hypothetical protein
MPRFCLLCLEPHPLLGDERCATARGRWPLLGGAETTYEGPSLPASRLRYFRDVHAKGETL